MPWGLFICKKSISTDPSLNLVIRKSKQDCLGSDHKTQNVVMWLELELISSDGGAANSDVYKKIEYVF